MFDSMSIGISGLTGFAKALKVVSNNITNLNTPGFKGSKLQFTDLFYQRGGEGANFGSSSYGMGLNTAATTINFQAGQVKQTGNPLDVAIDGKGYFVLRQGSNTRYTRDGEFRFDKDGFLVDTATGERVAGYDESDELTDVSLSGLRTNPPHASSKVNLLGNLSSSAADFTLSDVKVFDPLGGQQSLKIVFKNSNVTKAGQWDVTVSDSNGSVARGKIFFKDGKIQAESSTIDFTYAPTGVPSFALSLSFGADVTSFAAGTTSTLVVTSSDGYGAGSLTQVSIDEAGQLVTTYSNGQTGKGPLLALASFDSDLGLQPIGGNEFVNTDPTRLTLGKAGNIVFGSVQSGVVEGSNVDLSSEFSDLIVLQRGYQASSRVISTANQLLQELFDLKANR